MPQVAGITVDTYLSGEPKTYTFEAKRYGEALMRFFKSEGIELPYSPYNKKEEKNLLRIKSNMECGNKKKIEMSNFWD